MSITTKFGDKIVFLVNGKGAVMRVEGPAAVVDLDLDVDDLMDLQNEVYIAIHGRPDPEVSAQKTDDQRIKRLVKEAFAEMVGASAAPQFTQNVNVTESVDATEIFRQTNDLLVDGVASGLARFLHGTPPKKPRPKS